MTSHDLFRTPRALGFYALIFLAFFSLTLAGCGGGGSSGGSTAAIAGAGTCDTSDPNDPDCGTLFIGLTDADGDLTSYAVDVLSLSLTRADGTRVETLPASARVDFAEYTELTEFLTGVTVPPGVYVAGSIRLDYDTAEVFVEVEGESVLAEVEDSAGNPPGIVDVEIRLEDRDKLLIVPGRPQWLEVDFDLAASNTVELDTSPPTVVAEPLLVAEIDPVDVKTKRARGPLVDVDIAEGTYTILLRPFHRRLGDFGRLEITTDDATTFEIDGSTFAGDDGLAALADLETGTPTIALGTLNRVDWEFTASEVYAGTSVPGAGLDAVRGHVIARSGDTLTVKGATVVPSEGTAFFNDAVTVALSDDVRIVKAGRPAELVDPDAVSVGQRVQAFGEITSLTAGELELAPRLVRMLPTVVAGTVNAAEVEYLAVNLQSIGGRPSATYDFAGTGISTDLDADPENYEIAATGLEVADIDPGAPVRARGFPRAFGQAPEDFDASTVADFSEARARLVYGWGAEGTTAPFLSADVTGLVIDPDNPDTGARHFVDQAGIVTDLLGLDGAPVVTPFDDGLGMFAIGRRGSVQVFREFADFVDALNTALDGEAAVRALHAGGDWEVAGTTLTSRRVVVVFAN